MYAEFMFMHQASGAHKPTSTTLLCARVHCKLCEWCERAYLRVSFIIQARRASSRIHHDQLFCIVVAVKAYVGCMHAVRQFTTTIVIKSLRC